MAQLTAAKFTDDVILAVKAKMRAKPASTTPPAATKKK
ncbi:hypothetical protein SBA3_2950005 [Candidatus Sulfopaludibacter sp. SbA3]|nr:hypothetical protein SBA3_2950005 [Candidatus Sulfopaludibacter sp. SbA3]